MEIRIKTGEGLVCEYTQVTTNVLVKLLMDGGSDTGERPPFFTETHWLSRRALEEALKVVGAVDGQGVAAPPPPSTWPKELWAHTRNAQFDDDGQPAPWIEAGQPQVPPPAPRATRPQKDPPEAVARFEKALIGLMEDPPSSTRAEDGALKEIHVRELVTLHRSVFQNPVDAMAPVLAKHLGIDRQRVEMMVKARPNHGL